MYLCECGTCGECPPPPRSLSWDGTVGPCRLPATGHTRSTVLTGSSPEPVLLSQRGAQRSPPAPVPTSPPRGVRLQRDEHDQGACPHPRSAGTVLPSLQGRRQAVWFGAPVSAFLLQLAWRSSCVLDGNPFFSRMMQTTSLTRSQGGFSVIKKL